MLLSLISHTATFHNTNKKNFPNSLNANDPITRILFKISIYLKATFTV